MSLIAITPEYVVWDYTFVTKREELLEQPKGKWVQIDLTAYSDQCGSFLQLPVIVGKKTKG